MWPSRKAIIYYVCIVFRSPFFLMLLCVGPKPCEGLSSWEGNIDQQQLVFFYFSKRGESLGTCWRKKSLPKINILELPFLHRSNKLIKSLQWLFFVRRANKSADKTQNESQHLFGLKNNFKEALLKGIKKAYLLLPLCVHECIFLWVYSAHFPKMHHPKKHHDNSEWTCYHTFCATHISAMNCAWFTYY